MSKSMDCCTRRAFLGGGLSLASGLVPVFGAKKPSLPPYYESYLEDVARRINSHAGEATDGFWFLADIHVPVNAAQSGKIIAALAGKVPIDNVFCGGDLVYAYVADGSDSCRQSIDRTVDAFCRDWVEPISGAGLGMYFARGNHDFIICADNTFKSGLTLSADETKAIIAGRFTRGDFVTNEKDADACYGYFDNFRSKVRYIIADTTDSVDLTQKVCGVVPGMNAPQLHWLAGQALGTMKEGWAAVIVHHIPIASLVGWEDEVERYADFRHLCEAYQNRGKVKVLGRNFDFSGACGKIMLSISGHHHSERQTFQNGILYVTEPCDMLDRDYLYGSGEWCGKLPRKIKGTIHEQTFDAVQINPGKNLVFFTRVGGGQDRVIHTDPLKVKVGGRLPFESTRLKGPVKWGCYDADHIERRKNPESKWCPLVAFRTSYATVGEDGVLEGKRPGESIVVAMDENLNKEIFPVTVVP